MTNNQKILLGVGVVALAYYLFKDKFKGGGASTQTPSNPKLEGDVDKKYEACLKEFESSARPSFRYDPKQYKDEFINNCMKRSSTTNSSNLQTTIYTCKDGIKVTQTIDRDKAMVMKFSDPCLKHGGILSYTDPTDVPYQNNKGGCPVGFKEIPMNCIKAPCGVTCVPYAKPNGSF